MIARPRPRAHGGLRVAAALAVVLAAGAAPVPSPLAVASAQAQAFCDETRVMGGCATSIEAFPWQVSLFRVGGTDRVRAHFCGGSVVAPGWVLTAAHCIEDLLPTDPSPIAVQFGSTSLAEGAQVVDVVTVYAHPDYAGVGADDIALLELATPVSVPPVRLAGPDDDEAEKQGTLAVVTGWGNAPGALQVSGTVGGKGPDRPVETIGMFGTSRVLQGAEVPVVSNRRCDEAGDDTVICAGYESELVDACAGDSGGPLHAATPQGLVQVGIVSGGTLCVDEGERFTTYTRVSAYAEWIRATMAGETEVADLRRFPDYSLPATYADEALPMPLPRDPVTFEVQAGGDLPAADVTPDCAGFVADAPDVRLTFEDPGALLRFTVEAGTDTVLLINGPDGSWSCNDDRSADDLNPELVFSRPQAGQYDIWVGTFADPQELGAYPEAVLAVSGRR